jgi:predicted ester cyclase
MTVEENKRIVRRLHELLSEGKVKEALAMWAPDPMNHGVKVDLKAMESTFEKIRLLHERWTIHEMIGEGDWVVFRSTVEGVHGVKVDRINLEIFAKIEPTGRKYKVQHIHMYRVVDGKIKEHWANRDDLSAARQVGQELATTKDANKDYMNG